MSTTTITLSDQCKALRDLKKERDEAKKTYEAFKEQYALAQHELIERMESEDAEGHKADGTNFVPAETVYGQVQDRSEFIEWAEIHDDELLEIREIKERTNQLVRQHLDDGKPLPPGLGFYVRKYISQRAA